MRKMLLAAMVAAAVGAAQAVTVSWSTKQDLAAGATADLSGIETSGVFSVALVVTLDTLPTVSKAYLTAEADNGADHFFNAVGSSPNGQGRVFVNSLESFYSRGNLKIGTNVVGMVFERNVTANKANRSLVVTFYINGVAFNGLSYYTLGWDTVDIETITAGIDGAFYVANGAAQAEDFAALPEPTALALLALGMAGLALRRRVA